MNNQNLDSICRKYEFKEKKEEPYNPDLKDYQEEITKIINSVSFWKAVRKRRKLMISLI